ncbi:MAG: phosphate propanoyltransferase [Planctomycetota bacterium]
MRAGSASAILDRDRVEHLVAEVLRDRLQARGSPPPRAPTLSALVVNVSVRHMHITQQHLETLFGPGAELTPARWLYQEGEFAAEQAVDLVGPKRRLLQNVRILGPPRRRSQIELAFSDAIMLGIDVPVRMSGSIEGTPGCIVMGPKGYLVLEEGVIRAHRHVHMSPRDAEAYGVQRGDAMELVVEHPTCPVVLGNVVARVEPHYKLEVHIDSDEGNACDLPGATRISLRKPSACPGRCPLET